MITVRLTPQSLIRMRKKHDWLINETSRAIKLALEEGGENAKATVMRHPVFTPRTGELQRATTTRIVMNKRRKVLKVQNRKKYAAAIDKGSKPHLIVARNAPYLVFQVNGHWVRKKSVWHPGTKPYRFLENAATQGGHRTERVLRDRMSRIASRF